MAKVLLSISDAVLARVDEVAKNRRMSRSAFIQELAEREVGETQAEREARIDRAIESLRAMARRYGTGEGDSTQQIREERDSR